MNNLRQGVYTIPSGTGFLKRLAEGLLSMSLEDPRHDDFSLSRMRILLPTRRAGRELRDAFLTLSKDKPILLPRLQPIGDVDAEEIEIYLTGFGVTNHDTPPAISALERKFLLSNLIQMKDRELGLDAALSLAGELSRLIDTVHTEDLDFAGLTNIVPDTLSIHWQKTLEFLEIITEFWPKILSERGQIDPADRRNRLLKSLSHL
jgi:ATP-dependent helicase/nuclease subunit B